MCSFACRDRKTRLSHAILVRGIVVQSYQITMEIERKNKAERNNLGTKQPKNE